MAVRRPSARSRRTTGLALTRRGWLFLAFAGVALLWAYAADVRELLYASVFLVVLVAGSLLYAWTGRPRLSVARTFAPHVIEAGGTAVVSLAVRNLAVGRSRRAQWRDALPWPPGRTPVADLPPLQPRGARYTGRGGSTVAGYELSPPKRGVFPIGPLGVEVFDAFGLARSWLVAGEPQQIIVTPQVVPLAGTGLSATIGDGESRLVQRKSAGDDDDAMTREYRTGDAMRRVHWRASARHGDLMVRQEEQRSLPEARIIVDTRRSGYRDAAGAEPDDAAESPSFEWVVRMLASVTVHLRRTGFIVHLEETGSAQVGTLGQRRQRTWGDEEFLTTLASLRLTDAPAARPRDRQKGRGSNGPIVAIIGSPDEETLDWLVGQRRPGEIAVVFMVRNVSALDMIDSSFGLVSAAPVVGERLADAGWIVVPVRDDDDPAAAWEAVVIESGRSRTGA